MSYSKRIFFGDDPADDHIRLLIAAQTIKRIEAFKFQIPLRRRNRHMGRPHWDPRWPSIVQSAAEELKIETIQVNDQQRFKTKADSDAVKDLSEKRYKERINALCPPSFRPGTKAHR